MNVVKAKAKINLFLNVLGKRDDGYHIIESLVVFADDIYDLIAIKKSIKNEISLNEAGSEFKLPLDKNNLIIRSANLFSTATNYHYTLSKNIPLEAGLGGGSSDAASVARFLTNNTANTDKLLSLGADVPVCYHQKAAFCGGIGEIITTVKNLPKIYIVLVNPRNRLSTKTIFSTFSKKYSKPLKNHQIDFDNDFNRLLDIIIQQNNDLTDYAIENLPIIKEMLKTLDNQQGCYLSRMSGSGATCFAIFKNELDAINAKNNINDIYPSFWVSYTKVS